MEVKQLLEKIQQKYTIWKRERDHEETTTELLDIQQFLASYMYDHANTYKYNADMLKTFIDGLYKLEHVFERECSLDRFERILSNVSTLKEPLRTAKLVQLMNVMESFYKIPMTNSEEYNKANPQIIELYCKISAARDL